MKWLVALVALMFVSVPAFAAVVDVVPNPSFEQVRLDNASLPADWYQCNSYDDYCNSDALAWKIPPFTSDAFDGTQAVNLTDDPSGQAIDSIGTDVIGYNISSGTELNFSVYWKVIGDGENYPIFWVRDKVNVLEQVYWYFEFVVTDEVLTGTQCVVTNSTVFQVPFDCVNENVTGGWTKTSFTILTPAPFNPHFSAQLADGDSNEDFMIVDNFSLSYFQAPIVPPITGGVTGATGITVNAVIVIFALVVMLLGFMIIQSGAKGSDIKMTVTGFIVMFMGVIFAAIMYAGVNA